MTENFFTAADLAAPLKFLTSLGIGLLLGLQRERTPSAKAGLRTFALVALFGTVTALIAEEAASAWIIGAGVLLVGLMIIAAYHPHEERNSEADSGTTTVVAVLLCFGLGVMVWYDRPQLAVAIAIAATVLLHFKTELHGYSERISQRDLASILQLAVLTFIVLPLLPDRGFGPYGVLNPHHIWLMVVLVSGVSLAGYLALRLAGSEKSVTLVGAFGGLVSSTATTLVYARQSGAHPAMAAIGGTIIGIANLVVLARLAVISSVVAPAVLPAMLPVLASGLALGVVALVPRLRTVLVEPALKVPELGNPANLRVALGFGALYALILLGSAWLSGLAGSLGLYAIASASGFVDVDAITLSSLNLLHGGSVSVAVATTAVGIAFASNVAVKLGLVLFLGGRDLAKRCAPALVAPAIGVAVGLLLFT
jgi:uncharacterized membrane protein (DUF4010 family)